MLVNFIYQISTIFQLKRSIRYFQYLSVLINTLVVDCGSPESISSVCWRGKKNTLLPLALVIEYSTVIIFQFQRNLFLNTKSQHTPKHRYILSIYVKDEYSLTPAFKNFTMVIRSQAGLQNHRCPVPEILKRFKQCQLIWACKKMGY